LLTILIPSTANSKVVDPVKTCQAIKDCGLDPDWHTWLLIEETTLRAIKKDAEAYPITVKNLNDAQSDLDAKVSMVNQVNALLYQEQVKNKKQALQINDLKHPVWYKHPAFWGSMGVTAGVVLTVVLFIAVGAAK
jgi:hypothetical protein